MIPLCELIVRLARWAKGTQQCLWFDGASSNLETWCGDFGNACDYAHVGNRQHTQAAILFFTEELKTVMEERQRQYLERSGELYWRWEDFKSDLTRVVGELKLTILQSSEYKR